MGLGPGFGGSISAWEYSLIPDTKYDLDDDGSVVARVLGGCLCRALILATPGLGPF